MLIVTITGILLLVAGLVTALSAVTPHRSAVPRDDTTSQARSILDGRLAAGEIDEAEYRERTAVLGHDDRRSNHGSPWALVVGIAAIAVAVALLVTAVSSSMPAMGRWGPMGGHMGSMSTDGHMDTMTGRSATTDDTAPDPVDGARGLTVEAGDMFFAPDRIEITAGEQVNLTLDNTGQVFHDLAIDDLDMRLAADPGTTATGSLQVDQPGEYRFTCTVPGHASAGMRATLIVETPM